MQQYWKQIPNILTIFRMVLVVPLVILLVEPSATMRYTAIGIFIAAALTDWIDGVLARRWAIESDFGKLMDPLADKILVMAFLVMAVAYRAPLTGGGVVPGPLVVLILAREMWITGLRGWAATRGVVMAASSSGKIKTVLQMLALPLLFLYDVEFDLFDRIFTLQLIGVQLLIVSVFMSYWGALEYTQEVWQAKAKA